MDMRMEHAPARGAWRTLPSFDSATHSTKSITSVTVST